MSFLRWHKGFIGQLALIAVLLHAFSAAAIARVHVDANRGYTDSVLGWVVVCLQPQKINDAKQPLQLPGSHETAACAAICSANTHGVAIAPFNVLDAHFDATGTSARFLTVSRYAPASARVRSPWSLRDPPLSA